ncbi:MAG: hypothetical protein C4589_09450 [Peptococcaceae bacterium]|nr:MAG: hypothetical protein C4589_09450 [Peptococcaceae bacterium]
MFVRWRPFKGRKSRYPCLYEPAYRPDGRLYSKYVTYLGKDPVAAIRRLYREGRLTLAQVESISERKLPELADLKEELRKEANGNG